MGRGRFGGAARLARRLLPALVAAAPLLPSVASAQTASPQPAWVQRYFAAERRGPRFAHTWINRPRGAATPDGMALVAPGTAYQLRGTFRMAVLAATYSDLAPAVTVAALDTLFFGADGGSHGYSLNQYYREASGGRFAIAGTVTPWMSLARPRGYYGRQVVPYVRDVLLKADSTMDWRQYDNDGPDGVPNSGDDDGFVDLVTFVHPLADGVCRTDAAGGPVATGWRISISGAFSSQPFTTRSIGANGKPLKVEDFVLTAATHCGGSGVATVNIPAHEMGHALGLPDLYDLDQSTFGVGVWDVMGYGIYLRDGRPGLMSAWTRSQLGWLDVTRVTTNGTLTLASAESGAPAYRIDIPGTSEYLLLENRQRVGADAGLPGSGLLVWRIDEAALRATLPRYRANDDDARPGVALLQGDGFDNLRQRTNTGDSGDPLPGTSQRASLADNTAPSTRPRVGGPSGVALGSIAEQNGVVTLTVTFGGDPVRPRVMAQLLRGSGLTPVESARLDSLGNHDGAFDVGDVAAYLKRNGW